MLIGVGCDVIEIARVQKAIEREAFVERVYAPSEIAYCRSRGKQLLRASLLALRRRRLCLRPWVLA